MQNINGLQTSPVQRLSEDVWPTKQSVLVTPPLLWDADGIAYWLSLQKWLENYSVSWVLNLFTVYDQILTGDAKQYEVKHDSPLEIVITSAQKDRSPGYTHQNAVFRRENVTLDWLQTRLTASSFPQTSDKICIKLSLKWDLCGWDSSGLLIRHQKRSHTDTFISLCVVTDPTNVNFTLDGIIIDRPELFRLKTHAPHSTTDLLKPTGYSRTAFFQYFRKSEKI